MQSIDKKNIFLVSSAFLVAAGCLLNLNLEALAVAAMTAVGGASVGALLVLMPATHFDVVRQKNALKSACKTLEKTISKAQCSGLAEAIRVIVSLDKNGFIISEHEDFLNLLASNLEMGKNPTAKELIRLSNPIVLHHLVSSSSHFGDGFRAKLSAEELGCFDKAIATVKDMVGYQRPEMQTSFFRKVAPLASAAVVGTASAYAGYEYTEYVQQRKHPAPQIQKVSAADFPRGLLQTTTPQAVLAQVQPSAAKKSIG